MVEMESHQMEKNSSSTTCCITSKCNFLTLVRRMNFNFDSKTFSYDKNTSIC